MIDAASIKEHVLVGLLLASVAFAFGVYLGYELGQEPRTTSWWVKHVLRRIK